MPENKIFKAVATVTIYSVITRTLSFIFKIYLSRTVGAEVVGLYQISLSLFLLISTLSASGLPTVLSRKTAELRASDGNAKALDLVTAALAVGVTIAVATTGILLLLRPYLGALLSDSRAVPLFVIMLPATVSTCIYSIIRGWFWGRKQFRYFSLTEMLEEVLRILFTLFLVSGIVSGISGAYGIALAFTLSDVTVAIILILLFFFKGGRIVKTNAIKSLVRPALPLTAMRVFGSLVGTLIALILPSRLLKSGFSVAEATAAFGRIAGMAGPLLFAPNAIISSLAIVLIPEMSENGVKKNITQLNRHINGGITFSVIVCGLFLAVYGALGKELTEFLYKDTLSGEYLEKASWILLLMPVSQITSSALNSLGMEKQSFYSFLSGTGFMVASIYFLTPVIGVYSVVVANMLMLVISSIGNLYFLKKRTGLDFGFVKALIYVSLFIFPCTYLAKNLFELTLGASSFFALFLGCFAAAALYMALISFSGLADIGGFIKLNILKRKPQTAKKALL